VAHRPNTHRGRRHLTEPQLATYQTMTLGVPTPANGTSGRPSPTTATLQSRTLPGGTSADLRLQHRHRGRVFVCDRRVRLRSRGPSCRLRRRSSERSRPGLV